MAHEEMAPPQISSRGGEALNNEYGLYGRGPLGARRFCKECMERCNRLISYQNALLNFGSSTDKTDL